MSFIKNFKTYLQGKGLENDFEEGFKILGVSIFKILREKYKKNMEEVSAEVLAAQTMNFLTGVDIEKVYEESEEPLKSKIGGVKDHVKEEAVLFMDENNDAQDVVLQTLWLRDNINRAHLGRAYLDSPQKKQIDFLIDKYKKDNFLNPDLLDTANYLSKVRLFCDRVLSSK
jgi:hypothetical protein